MRSFANIISLYAETNKQVWPFVTVPKFEVYGENIREQSHIEIVTLIPRVWPQDREAYVDYANANVKSWVEEGHMIQKGSLERLQDDETVPYRPFISALTAEGIVEDPVDREFYSPLWQWSPPPATYGMVNWNTKSIPYYESLLEVVEETRYEVVATPVSVFHDWRWMLGLVLIYLLSCLTTPVLILSLQVRPYISVPMTMSYEEHDQYHSKLQESSHENPHSFLVAPIHRNTTDYNSDIVAWLGTGASWDAGLLNLLPNNVEGIHAVLKNTCNQTFTYIIRGRNAIYLGDSDLHESKYDDMEVIADLALHTHPDFTKLPGHCLYSMVSRETTDSATFHLSCSVH